ncbi:MAG: hypothetical protein WD397_05965 [Wenzhouxiangellaceae bacterium]
MRRKTASAAAAPLAGACTRELSERPEGRAEWTFCTNKKEKSGPKTALCPKPDDALSS